MADPDGERIVRRLAGFGRLLRAAGIEVGPGRLRDAVAALGAVDLRVRAEFYWALRCTLIAHRDEIGAFDAAFAAYWDRGELVGSEPDETVASPPSEGSDTGRATGEGDDRERSTVAPDGAQDALEAGDGERVGVTWSAAERLRELDFARYSDAELRAARRLMGRIARALPRRLSRRLQAAHDGRALDERRTLRAAMRTDGYPIARAWRRRRLVERRVVFLIDVSGSMEPYARAMMMFLQAAVAAGRAVDAFTFGTRLTRVTRVLRGRDADRALRAAACSVPDWAGGTRIGDNIARFNRLYEPRGLTRGAVVVIVSDGWERGDPGLLVEHMRRLHRAVHTLIWVNPLAADPQYRPLAQGMAAALPHVDVFLPGESLRSLEGLARVLERLPVARRGPPAQQRR